ncbi:MAG: aconitate hydratase [Planctomycetes bacterium]|nr:aconitate hydratase [Planctomycetota bacterium]
MSETRSFKLDPQKRVLYLTKDPDLIRKQIAGELTLTMADVAVGDLLDDINTDVMTPAWVCFDWEPTEIAKNAYAGLIVDGERLIPPGALFNANFEVIVSGMQKGVGSSRETAVQCEKYSGIRLAVAASFAPIHARNNINSGVLMANHEQLARLEKGEELSIEELSEGHDPVTQRIIQMGGLFPFSKALAKGEVSVPLPSHEARPQTMCEKIIASHLVDAAPGTTVRPGDSVLVQVDGGYSHEFTTAQVHAFLTEEFGEDYTVQNPQKFAVFEDHLIYADHVERYRKFLPKIEVLRAMQRTFQEKTGVLGFNAVDGVSPGICHQLARETIIEPGEVVLATDSHTCMGGGSNAYAYGVGTTEYAALVQSGLAPIVVPESIRFELTGELGPGVTAKDVMLYILMTYAKREETLNRCMEFTGPGLRSMSMDERATLANMATECTAKTGICEADEATIEWIRARRPELSARDLRAKLVAPDEGAHYEGGFHTLDLGTIEAMVAHPGDPDRGIASDPKNGEFIRNLDSVAIDIAYGGSCTAGKEGDLDLYVQVMREALEAGRKVKDGVSFYIQFGSTRVESYARAKGYHEILEQAGVKIIPPGCGACIGCGPGVSDDSEQVTVSAINRNYKGRSGPGRLYLASPLTVAASAVTGVITEFKAGMFQETAQVH